MATIERCFLLLNGVVVGHLWQAVITDLQGQGLSCDEELRRRLRSGEQECFEGSLSLPAYYNGALEVIPVSLNADALAGRVAESLAPLEGMPSLLETMARSMQLHLVSCFSKNETVALVERLGLQEVLPQGRFVLTGELKSTVVGGGLLPALQESGLLQPGRSLWVDDHPGRTSEVIRAGIDAIIFVDAMRLGRELSLRRLI